MVLSVPWRIFNAFAFLTTNSALLIMLIKKLTYTIAALLLVVMLPGTAQAQSKITGYIYELQSGEPLEGTRVHIKDRAGLEMSRVEPVYTNAEGYFEISNLAPNDYRVEVSHVFETEHGRIGLSMFTHNDVLEVTEKPYQLTMALSRFEADNYRKHVRLGNINQLLMIDDAPRRKRSAKELAFFKEYDIKIPKTDEENRQFYAEYSSYEKQRKLYKSTMKNANGQYLKFLDFISLVKTESSEKQSSGR